MPKHLAVKFAISGLFALCVALPANLVGGIGVAFADEVETSLAETETKNFSDSENSENSENVIADDEETQSSRKILFFNSWRLAEVDLPEQKISLDREKMLADKMDNWFSLSVLHTNDGDRVGGTAAPNRYGAPSEFFDDGDLKFGAFFSTKILALNEHPDVKENDFFKWLNHAKNWEISEEENPRLLITFALVADDAENADNTDGAGDVAEDSSASEKIGKLIFITLDVNSSDNSAGVDSSDETNSSAPDANDANDENENSAATDDDNDRAESEQEDLNSMPDEIAE